jgi:voltage-gated potassium channel Kch
MTFLPAPRHLLTLLGDHPLRGLLWTTAALLAIRPAIEQTAAVVVLDAVFIAVLVAVVRRLVRSRAVFLGCLVLLTLAVAARIVRESIVGDEGATRFDWTITATTALSGLFVAFVLALLLNYALRAPRVTQNTVLAAVCAYVLIGVVWGFAFLLVYEFNPSAFTLDPADGAPEVQLRYFSMVTLTTIGYGDIMPKSALARAMSAMEGLVGQIYLTAIVARLVGIEVAYASRATESDDEGANGAPRA